MPSLGVADCTVQFVGTLPTVPVDGTAVPFMNHIAVLPRAFWAPGS
jgi:hypothetical protein